MATFLSSAPNPGSLNDRQTRKPTLIDVARGAGVSRQTVSRVLNSSASVAEDTRRRVLAAMTDIGYRHNRIASSLRSGRTRTLGFVLSNVMNPFFAAELRGAQDVVEACGYRVLVCNTDEDPDKEQYYLRALREQRVDGAIVVAISDASEASLRELADERTTVVVLNRFVPGMDSLSIDHPGGVRLAVEHLLKHGRRRIGLVLSARFTNSDPRVQSYVVALAEHGLAYEPTLLACASENTDDVRDQVGRLLDAAAPPDALVTGGYMVTLGVLEALARRNLHSPDPVALVANTRTEWAPFVSPPLTTVSGDPYALGAEAARVLLGRLEHVQAVQPIHRVFPNRLDLRSSCGTHS